jgi:hypothetical protein
VYISNVKIVRDIFYYRTVTNALNDEATGENEEAENNENFVGPDTNSLTNLTDRYATDSLGILISMILLIQYINEKISPICTLFKYYTIMAL